MGWLKFHPNVSEHPFGNIITGLRNNISMSNGRHDHDDELLWDPFPQCWLLLVEIPPRHYDVLTRHYWPFVRGIHQSTVVFHHKGPVMRHFSVLWMLSLVKLLWCRWFETSWRLRDVIVKLSARRVQWCEALVYKYSTDPMVHSVKLDISTNLLSSTANIQNPDILHWTGLYDHWFNWCFIYLKCDTREQHQMKSSHNTDVLIPKYAMRRLLLTWINLNTSMDK